jgi:glycogen operon protein
LRDYAVYPGNPYPLGATWDGSGVNFALAAENAEAVELCLFDEPYGKPEVARIPMREQTDYVWHVYLPEARPGQVYGYRVYGPFDPANGHRFNPNKLLLDPYAKSTTGIVEWSEAMFGYPIESESDDRDLLMDERDSAPGMVKAVVIEPAFSWGDDRPPKTPWHNTIIYEAHVKGLTRLHPDLPESLRGTYAALADRRTIKYLQDLGITAIELMPVHQFVPEKHLIDRGLTNYWGYNTIGFFAPDPRYSASRAPGGRVNEFKTMVKTLHNAGIEVILDVVYNHTAEGNHLGPTMSFRGIDNKAYYRLVSGDERYYMDYTGTGNTLNMLNPRTVQLIMDSLRYWVTEMHVDGFRFDLAAALARELHEVDRLSAFFDIIHQDPVLSQVKLIAEPWDVGEGGYQVGNFPVLWTEWNGKYRDTVRRYWRGDAGQVSDLAYRLTGSSDLYAHNGRLPYASINFVTAHDGFTLRDLVSYNEKHNEANGEDNQDGHNENLSWNHGVEGETTDREIMNLRTKQMRNLLTTLFISQGVPMLLMGDEVMRTQGGNNNAYCQDNETSWMPWTWTPEQQLMLDWTKRLIAFRKQHPTLRRRRYFHGTRIRGAGAKDIAWFQPDGSEMTDEAWSNEDVRAFGFVISGAASDILDSGNNHVVGDTLMFLLNSSDEPARFRLPAIPGNGAWQVALDTSQPERTRHVRQFAGGDSYIVAARSMVAMLQPGPV